MTVLLVVLILLPWSIWRQMHAHEVTAGGLVKLPAIFAAIAVLGGIARDLPAGSAAVAYFAISALVAIAFGIWRGRRLTIWRDASGALISIGNRTTITLWGAMFALKFALGAVASITAWFPSENSAEIFGFLALTFVAQNLVVARRSIWQRGSAVRPAAIQAQP